MPFVTRIATTLLVVAFSWTGLLALPAACDSEVTMSSRACSGSGCCCLDTCLCPVPRAAPSPQPPQPAGHSTVSGNTDTHDSAAAANHPFATGLADTPRPLHAPERFGSAAGPRRVDRTLELFCILLV